MTDSVKPEDTASSTPPAETAGVHVAEIGQPVDAPPPSLKRNKVPGLATLEKLTAKHSQPNGAIDPFFIAAARGANGWAQGKELTEPEFLSAVEAAKGLKMHASLPPHLLSKPFPKARR